MSGIRASLIVFVGVGVANLFNYIFHLLSARHLGPSAYGDVATLTAVSGIITLPLAGAQAFVARHVASNSTSGRELNDDGYVSGFGGAVLIAGVILTLLLLAASPLLRSALSIHSLTATVFTVLVTAPSFLAPILVGAIQGAQRFLLFAAATAVPSVLRVILAAGALAAGFGVAGVMAATFVAAVLTLAFPLYFLRGRLGGLARWHPRIAGREARTLAPVIGGMLAITCLSSDDLVAAKIVFSPHEAGLYSSASLVGRVILYLPAAIVAVLLPKVSARASTAHGTVGIFARSFLATAVFCAAATLIYTLAPHLIMRVAFGAKYEGAASLLWMFGVAMSIYALLNVLLIYRVGHGETRTCWLLLAGSLVQALAFVAFHASPRELLTVSIATGAGLLLAATAGPSRHSPLSLRRYRHDHAAHAAPQPPLSPDAGLARRSLR
jgi:O-antigen/teichoic acid export membrane protein